MNFSRGDIVGIKNNVNDDLFLINKVEPQNNKVEAYRIKVKSNSEQKKPNRWYYEYNNTIKTMYIRFDKLSILSEYDIEKVSFYMPKFEEVLLHLTELRKMNEKKLQWKDHVSKRANAIRRKKVKNQNMTAAELKLLKATETSRIKNGNSPKNLYNEKITIVRG